MNPLLTCVFVNIKALVLLIEAIVDFEQRRIQHKRLTLISPGQNPFHKSDKLCLN